MPDIRVIGPDDRVSDTASGAMVREAAVSQDTVGAKKVWAGYAELPPGLVSAAHHHGEAESVIYIVSGRARFFWGDGLEHSANAGPGDFIWVPPHLIHVEMNASETESVRTIVSRSTQETLVFNVPTPADWTPASA